ncbi:MAG: hypothetical protein PHN75_07700 [Syntrophales bacterium]|nr:hypothetical protein [Syntrophales bacterium]
MMKYFLIALMIILSAAAAQAADVGVSVSVGQPGFYGRIDIGAVPHPEIIYTRPVVIAPPPGRVVEEPIYMHVPPGHAKNWRKHCNRYNACGRPVYFVQDRWYNDVYVPRHQERMRHDREPDRGHGWDKGDGRGHGHGRD